MSNILAWHFTRMDGTAQHLKQREEVGKTYKIGGGIIPCERGYHASINPIDALGYAPGLWVRRVECGGIIVQENDKLACSERTVIAEADATNTIVLFAVDCAERVLPLFEARFPNDKRPRNAIQAVRDYVAGSATKADLKTAAYAANAADAAAYAAANAARAAANAAANAAYAAYAAYAAANAAYAAYAANAARAAYAARAAEMDWQSEELGRSLLALLGLSEEGNQ